ncbi:MAG TPA: hypothetical protein VNO30_41510 [Kofleriaceae bacterium]|nr:hypothetical protein [Kofleriaceae bacterium]
MSPVLRPTFSDGQVIGASDLNAHVDYDRLALGLHERTEHLWGVASGLSLREIPHTMEGETYCDVELSPGRAVDRLGRAIVAIEPRLLDPRELESRITGAQTETDVYPVFVQALDIEHTGQTRPGKCAVGQVSRIEEGLLISFGAPGSEIPLLEQRPATVNEELGAPPAGDKVLVGWVTWNKKLGRFRTVETSVKGRGVRYVGVVASEVVAGGGALGLRTRPSGARYALTLTENSTGGCELRFGKQDGPLPPSPTFTIDDKGNVTYAGTLSPLPAANVLAESGVIFHGLRLPLPAGVDEDQVSSGKVRLHAVLAPLLQVPASIKASAPIPVVQQCSADVDGDRRVRCIVRWYDLAHPTQDFVELPSACSYLLVASGT